MAFDFSQMPQETPVVPPVAPRLPQRRCLLCAAAFTPAHKGAWVCEPCRASDEWQQPVSYVHGTALSRLRRALGTARTDD